VNADCTAGGVTTTYDICCTGMAGGQSTKLCANAQIAALSGGMLTCP
jgi:hypothetical protein